MVPLPIHANFILTKILVALCIFGFGWVVWGQIDKFINKKASVTIGMTNTPHHEIPVIVFCSRHPYQENSTWPELTISEDFEEILQPPQVDYEGVGFNEFSHWNKRDGSDWIDFETVYNGRCKLFRKKSLLETGAYMLFTVRRDPNPLDVFIMTPGEELYLLWQNWGLTSLAHVSVEDSGTISLYQDDYYFLEGRDDFPCQGEERQLQTNCLMDLQVEALQNFECLPNQLRSTILPDKNLCQFNQRTESNTAMKASSEIINQASKLCPRSCRMTRYQAMYIPNTSVQGGPFYHSEKYHLFIYFPTDETWIHEQFLIYDLVSIVSAVGGGLGLFLGCSCFSLAKKASGTVIKNIEPMKKPKKIGRSKAVLQTKY